MALCELDLLARPHLLATGRFPRQLSLAMTPTAVAGEGLLL